MSKEIVVKLDGFSVGGEAVGAIVRAPDSSLIGMRGFVRFGIPAETVEVKDIDIKKGFFRASLAKIVESSSQRKEPECQYFGVCGGCDLQHVSYEAQLVHKKRMVADALKAGGITVSSLQKISDIIPSNPFGYRKRVTLHIDNAGKIGFYQRGTRSVITVSSCLVSDPRISNILSKLSAPNGFPATMHLDQSRDRIDCVIRYPDDVPKKAIQQLEVNLAFVNSCKIFSRRKIVHTFGEPPIIAGSFTQINPDINQKLIAAVVERAKTFAAKNVEDLYSGAGNFAFPLAGIDCAVTAVESDANLCEAAKERGCGGVRFFNQTVEQYLKSRGDKKVDLVVADPPRSGLGDLVDKFSYTKNLILISCHLPSCVRDLKRFQDLGWRVEQIVPFDMFPQTSYVEVMTVLLA